MSAVNGLTVGDVMSPLVFSLPEDAAVERAAGCPDPRLVTVGYREMSLVFLAGTGAKRAEPDALAAYQAATPGAVVLVSHEQEEAFRAAAAAAGYDPQALESLEVINYSNGKRLVLTFFGRPAE